MGFNTLEKICDRCGNKFEYFLYANKVPTTCPDCRRTAVNPRKYPAKKSYGIPGVSKKLNKKYGKLIKNGLTDALKNDMLTKDEEQA